MTEFQRGICAIGLPRMEKDDVQKLGNSLDNSGDQFERFQTT